MAHSQDLGDDSPVDDSSDTASFTSGENDIFAIKEALIPPRNQKVAGTTEVSFDGLLKQPLLLKEDLKEGCGGQLWPAGMVLARYMLRYHREDLAGKRILELGAGGGLVGLAVAQGCQLTAPPKLYITDQLPMYSLMKENIELNNLGSKVGAAIYDWGGPMPEDIDFESSSSNISSRTITINNNVSKPTQEQQHSSSQHQSTPTNPKPDIILAADCVYFEPAFPLLRDTLLDLINQNPNRDAVCYFCFKKRRKADWRCIRMIEKILDVKEVEDDVMGQEKEGYGNEAIYLYRLRRKS